MNMFIDTQEIYENLYTEGKFTDIQAGMLTRVIKNIALSQMDQFASKLDLADMESRLFSKIEQGETAIRSELASLKSETKRLNAEMETFRMEIGAMRTDLGGLLLESRSQRSDLESLRTEVGRISDQLTIRLGTIMAAGIGVLVALDQLAG